uniref:Uncharacterized protein n=1 Tax=Anguilla anguilla TaxID=7936 RepID=A0A0E9XPT0_ANGAN
MGTGACYWVLVPDPIHDSDSYMTPRKALKPQATIAGFSPLFCRATATMFIHAGQPLKVLKSKLGQEKYWLS